MSERWGVCPACKGNPTIECGRCGDTGFCGDAMGSTFTPQLKDAIRDLQTQEEITIKVLQAFVDALKNSPHYRFNKEETK